MAIKYHGKMTTDYRDNVIKQFQDNPKKQVLLASLKCGSYGLNLTMASRVINVDPWFNNCVEQQAFCRIYRRGQTKETMLTRVVVSGTVDDDILTMQDRKQENIDEAIGEDANSK